LSLTQCICFAEIGKQILAKRNSERTSVNASSPSQTQEGSKVTENESESDSDLRAIRESIIPREEVEEFEGDRSSDLEEDLASSQQKPTQNDSVNLKLAQNFMFENSGLTQQQILDVIQYQKAVEGEVQQKRECFLSPDQPSTSGMGNKVVALQDLTDTLTCSKIQDKVGEASGSSTGVSSMGEASSNRASVSSAPEASSNRTSVSNTAEASSCMSVVSTAEASSNRTSVSNTAEASSNRTGISNTTEASSCITVVSNTVDASSNRTGISNTTEASCSMADVSNTAEANCSKTGDSNTAEASCSMTGVSNTAEASSNRTDVSNIAEVSCSEISVSNTAEAICSGTDVSIMFDGSCSRIGVSSLLHKWKGNALNGETINKNSSTGSQGVSITWRDNISVPVLSPAGNRRKDSNYESEQLNSDSDSDTGFVEVTNTRTLPVQSTVSEKNTLEVLIESDKIPEIEDDIFADIFCSQTCERISEINDKLQDDNIQTGFGGRENVTFDKEVISSGINDSEEASESKLMKAKELVGNTVNQNDCKEKDFKVEKNVNTSSGIEPEEIAEKPQVMEQVTTTMLSSEELQKLQVQILLLCLFVPLVYLLMHFQLHR
jgi:hypothetical protein